MAQKMYVPKQHKCFRGLSTQIAAEAIENIQTVVSLNREYTFEALYQKNLTMLYK